MITRSRQKIDELRRQPQEVRLRAVIKLSLVIGAAVVIVSLILLLPLQIYLTRLSLP